MPMIPKYRLWCIGAAMTIGLEIMAVNLAIHKSEYCYAAAIGGLVAACFCYEVTRDDDNDCND